LSVKNRPARGRLALTLAALATYSAISIRHALRSERCPAVPGSPPPTLSLLPDRALAGLRAAGRNPAGLLVRAATPCLPMDESFFFDGVKLESKWGYDVLWVVIPPRLLVQPRDVVVAVRNDRGFRREAPFRVVALQPKTPDR